MKAIRTGGQPSTLEALEYVDLPDAPAPGPGEITVAVKASSLNYHDYAVVKGMLPTAQGRIPMSDGAGEVVAVGEGVTEYGRFDLLPGLDRRCPALQRLHPRAR
jgi:NADPH:quinone reductase-like Zn-dependent oxidoreductase